MGSSYRSGHGELPQDEIFVLVTAVKDSNFLQGLGRKQKFEVKIAVSIETLLLILFTLLIDDIE
jgi:hypothetical protein